MASGELFWDDGQSACKIQFDIKKLILLIQCSFSPINFPSFPTKSDDGLTSLYVYPFLSDTVTDKLYTLYKFEMSEVGTGTSLTVLTVSN